MRQPAPRLTLRSRANASRTAIVTVFAGPGRTAVPVPLGGVAHGAAGWLVALTGDGCVDWIGAGATAEQTPFDTDALIARCRVGRNGMVEQAHVGGTYFHADADALARLEPSLAAMIGP